MTSRIRQSEFSKDRTPGERMWPLDIALVVTSALVLYLILVKLRFDDPRPLYSGRLYAVLVPVAAVTISLVLRGVASQYVQKSVQLGFLFSVAVHLLLLIVALQWVIFRHYYPDAVTGVDPERAPVRRTAPESVFQTPRQPNQPPDWSRPVDAEATSRVVPAEDRQPLPTPRSEARAELPAPPDRDLPVESRSLARATPADSVPQPADRPSRWARRIARGRDSNAPAGDGPSSPTSPASEAPRIDPAETERPAMAARRRSPVARAVAPQPSDRVENRVAPQPVTGVTRPSERSAPTVGIPESLRRETPRVPRTGPDPIAAAPTAPSVEVADVQPAAERLLAKLDVARQRRDSKAEPSFALDRTDPTAANRAAEDVVSLPPGSPAARQPSRPTDGAKGQPRVAPSLAATRPAGRARPERAEAAFGADPDLPDLPSADPEAVADRAVSAGVSERTLPGESGRRSERVVDRSPSAGRGLPDAPPDLEVETPLKILPSGLSARRDRESGATDVIDQPRVASLDLSRERRVQRDAGGRPTPAGSEIASVDAFNRRVMRTRGGAAPAPTGVVGPATEEAIERGLAYLAERQNDDGSWSLQGHGETVLLRSDSAATGLCLLAFQGAGYTHRQHQYAGVVARGLQYLLDHQRTNGDLYVRENPLSDQNAALYSHGIAALAVCEAYGMTQDAGLEERAQLALDYIVATQHRRLGGWRYTPQVSSDTSVTGWMMMALKSGELAGLRVPADVYEGIDDWLDYAQAGPLGDDRYRYNPFAPDTPTQRHGRQPTPTMTSVGMLMRMYSGWSRENASMQSAADYLLEHPPRFGAATSPRRDTYYWYYATQVMFHMGGDWWSSWNSRLNPILVDSQTERGPNAGSWDPAEPVPDRWGKHAGRVYVTAMNLLNLEVYYRHLPLYEETAD